MTVVANAEILIEALTHLSHHDKSSDGPCLALRALGKPDLADRYADALARVIYWGNKPDHFFSAGVEFGDPADAWTDKEIATHDRDLEAYFTVVREIKSAFGIGGDQ